jgi:hypothetical protein
MPLLQATNVYYAARSSVALADVCASLAETFELPAFNFDTEDNWCYGWSERPGLKFNVTKADDYRTIQTWIDGCPSGMNYQVIVTVSAAQPTLPQRLSSILGSDAIEYHRSVAR